ncbi:MAG TPA: cytochrome c3 family protein [Candidatus Acidoferrum sp.]|nr:cytochrome c3 family protein [Candidatus Acidoferrum sp.]
MPRIRTAKALAKRIDLQYFKRPNLIKRWRMYLTIGLVVVAVGWIAYAGISKNQKVYTKGPLSSAHAVLTTSCDVCHVRDATYRAAVPDKACLGCHDAPAHNKLATFTPTCASCHVEHTGKSHLAEVASSGCAQCHGDLKTTDGSQSVNPHIGGFDKQHPQFAAVRAGQKDPGTINFDHSAHLKPTLRGQRGAVQLVCDDCHRPTNTIAPWPNSVAMVQPASQQPVIVGVTDSQQRKRRSVEAGGGAYMTAIRYVNQCAACHVLQFDRLIAEPAPHDKPEIVHAFIMKKYSDYIAQNPGALKLRVGEVDTDAPAGYTESVLRPTRTELSPLARSASEWVSQRTAAAEDLLWKKNCKICHLSTEHDGPGLPQSVKAVIPTRWMPHAEFDHQAHRMLTCTACHAGIPNSQRSADVNMPGIELCRPCHKEAGPAKQAAQGNCYECHSYHDWRKEQPIKGIMEIAAPSGSSGGSASGGGAQ